MEHISNKQLNKLLKRRKQLYSIIHKYKLTSEQLDKYMDKAVMYNPTIAKSLNSNFYGYQNMMVFNNLCKFQKLSSEFIDKYIDKYVDRLDWNEISRYQNLSLEQIEKYKDRLNWERLIENKYVNDKIEFGVFYD